MDFASNSVIRVAIYARYSSDNQREESIDAQLRAAREYCDKLGYVIVKIYTDEAKTATTDRRPQFQQLIADSSLGIFDVVLVHKVNRFARNRYDAAYYKRKLKLNGVRVEYVTEKLDGSPESIILESVLEGFAEYFSKDLAREARKGMTENALIGVHAGGRPPYGMKLNPETKKLEIDEHQSKAFRFYVENRLANKSKTWIADQLNHMGYKTQRGMKFTKNSFDGWDSNEKYIGIYVWDRGEAKNEDGRRNSHKSKALADQIRIPGGCPRLMSDEEFEALRAMNEKRKKTPGAGKAKLVYLLSGKVKCGKCGSNYSGDSYRNSKSAEKTLLSYYKCCSKCGNTNVRKEDLEQAVIDHLVITCFSDVPMEQIAERVQAIYAEEKTKMLLSIAPLKLEIAELELKIENWLELAGNGIKSIVNKIKEAEERLEKLQFEVRQAEVVNRAAAMIDKDIVIRFLNSKKHSLFSSDEEAKKQVLQELIDAVVIEPSDTLNSYTVEVTYRVFSGGGEAQPTKTLSLTSTFTVKTPPKRRLFGS